MFDAAERAVEPEAEEPALPGLGDRTDTVDNPEGSDRDRTCRWGGHGYRVHDLFLLSIVLIYPVHINPSPR